ncbi:MAG: hypothetical protein IE910_01200 [Brevundimonas sp.]|nr:hypothetical protein [Brevundimonas sp.]
MAWVRYEMWDRWRDLTRFRFASEMALASYRTYVNSFPVTSTAPLVMTDPAGSAFKCDLADFTSVLNDDQQLYRVLFPSYVALVEDLARELVETAHTLKEIPRTAFVGLDASAPIDLAAENWITGAPVEAWGAALLKVGNRNWSGLKGGRRGVVEAVTVRNLCAHGVPVYNQKALNRLAAVSTPSQTLPALGDPIVMDRTAFTRHVANLRGFARSIADGVANLPNIP